MNDNSESTEPAVETPGGVSEASSDLPKYRGISPKYKSVLSNETTRVYLTEKNKINDILEKEKQSNKLDSWNKLDKMTKINKLNQFAEKYIQKNKLSLDELANLKEYLVNCINQSKLLKSKDVICDKLTMEITEIPSLFFHPVNRNFTLRVQDAKRTLKSLAKTRLEI